jgi:aldose 1-epimerase
MEGGFPGETWIEVFYTIESNENKLNIEYRAITDKETPLNLTNHVYFNLNGEDSSKKVYNHLVKINADSYLDYKPDCSVTGKINSVANSKFDLRNYTELKQVIKEKGQWPDEGYDNFFIANGDPKSMRVIASAKNPDNGILLDVLSDQNGVQFYTGNYLNSKRSDGRTYLIHEGFCFEAHNYPDSVNKVNKNNKILLS